MRTGFEQRSVRHRGRTRLKHHLRFILILHQHFIAALTQAYRPGRIGAGGTRKKKHALLVRRKFGHARDKKPLSLYTTSREGEDDLFGGRVTLDRIQNFKCGLCEDSSTLGISKTLSTEAPDVGDCLCTNAERIEGEPDNRRGCSLTHEAEQQRN